MNEHEIIRGDIFYVRRGRGGTTGNEQYAGRPGIIVSNDANNQHSETVEVVYTTTRCKAYLPTHTMTKSTPLESTVLCEQVTTVSVERLGDYIGRCTRQEMQNIDAAIMISLGLAADGDLVLRFERDTYKRLYEMAVQKLANATARIH